MLRKQEKQNGVIRDWKQKFILQLQAKALCHHTSNSENALRVTQLHLFALHYPKHKKNSCVSTELLFRQRKLSEDSEHI